ncbi:Ent-kaurene oxidase [Grifola frondosa]|uniref:Ent-kaurene oxidase n=1 Tax=Grifola frondosa TaxID=5627 RepID=A0A1C7MSR9_GRIFR|nr:Ent-kaurene oxidase [Grifola frondosa]
MFAVLYNPWHERLLNPIYSIPTIGPSAPLISYLGSYRFIRHGRKMLKEGYDKVLSCDGAFKVPMLDQWLVVVSGSKLIDDLRKSPEDQLSFLAAAAEFVQTEFIFGPGVSDDPYHTVIVREKLNRTLHTLMPEVIDEISIAYKDLIPPCDNDWVSVPGMPTMLQIVARVTNRVLVGVPKCHDPDYLNWAINFTINATKARMTINMFPLFLKPLVGRMLTRVSKNVQAVADHLRPMMEERTRNLEEYGDGWVDKPVKRLPHVAYGRTRARGHSFDSVVKRILLLNFASVHTSSTSITHALYHLAASPEYIQPIREEVEAVLKEEGDWTKAAMGKMYKLDSFMRESQRLNGIHCISVVRKAVKEVTLSDGTRIPSGTLVAAAAEATHHDEENYVDPDVFDPFRFSKLRDDDGEGEKYLYVSTSADYLPFGYGKHACPGRWFASAELKAMIAYLVLNYDIKFAGDGKRPDNIFLGTAVVPARDAQVLFRRRRAL